jgi:hypothetical protein
MTQGTPAEAAAAAPTYDRRMVGWLSLAQLITWGSVFYTFALLMEPVERELGMTRAQSSRAVSLAMVAVGAVGFTGGGWVGRGAVRGGLSGS